MATKNTTVFAFCAILFLAVAISGTQSNDIILQIRKVVTCNATDHPVKFRQDEHPYCLSAVIVDDTELLQCSLTKILLDTLE
jgi:hypothetical protein